MPKPFKSANSSTMRSLAIASIIVVPLRWLCVLGVRLGAEEAELMEARAALYDSKGSEKKTAVEFRLTVHEGLPPGSIVALTQDPLTKQWSYTVEPAEVPLAPQVPVFDNFDRNKDGVISREEWDANPLSNHGLEVHDLRHQSDLSDAERSMVLRKRQQQRHLRRHREMQNSTIPSSQLDQYASIGESGQNASAVTDGAACSMEGPLVAQGIWRALQETGLKHVFGLPGGGIINFMKGAQLAGITWLDIGHEEMNGFVAQSYGLSKGTAGVLATTHGPGAAATVNSVYNAVEEVKPLLHIMQYSADLDPYSFQQWPVHQILETVTKFVYFLRDPKDAYDYTKDAFAAASALRTAVVILVEENLLKCDVARSPTNGFKMSERPTSEYVDFRTLGVPKLEDRIPGETTASEVPASIAQDNVLVVLAGSLKPQDRQAVREFLVKHNLPYVTTFKSRMKFPDGYGHYFGCLGSLGIAAAHHALLHAKHVLIINPQAGGLGAESFYGRRFGLDAKLMGNATTFTQITDAVVLAPHCFFDPPNGRSENYFVLSIAEVLKKLTIVDTQNVDFVAKLTAFKDVTGAMAHPPPRSKLEEFASSAGQALADVASGSAGAPHIALQGFPGVFTGVGNHWYAIGKYMDGIENSEYFSPTNWGSIGVALPNAIGFHYATGRPAWVFEGDGGAAYSASALNFVLSNTKLPLTVNLFIDGYYSAVSVNEYVCAGCKQLKQCTCDVNIPDATRIYAQITNMLPEASGVGNKMIFSFNETEEYKQFLTQQPVAVNATQDEPLLRILIVQLPSNTQNNVDSQVYEFEFSDTYIAALDASNATAAVQEFSSETGTKVF